jgi:hypothetical protein
VSTQLPGQLMPRSATTVSTLCLRVFTLGVSPATVIWTVTDPPWSRRRSEATTATWTCANGLPSASARFCLHIGKGWEQGK